MYLIRNQHVGVSSGPGQVGSSLFHVPDRGGQNPGILPGPSRPNPIAPRRDAQIDQFQMELADLNWIDSMPIQFWGRIGRPRIDIQNDRFTLISSDLNRIRNRVVFIINY